MPVAFLVVLGLAAGSVWVFGDRLREALGEDPRVGVHDVVPRIAPAPTPVLAAPTPPATPVSSAALAARLDAVGRGSLTQVGIVVLDATTGAVQYDRSGSLPQAPASTLKVLSGLVALDVLGPDTTFTTRVVQGSGGQIVLVGGGDPLLRSARPTGHPGGASLQELADKTVATLRDRGVTSVSLGYDATLFGQPAWNPEWPETFKWHVAPITALTADHARPDLSKLDRAPDPSRFAADRFAGYLQASGIAVTAVAAAKAPAGAAPVASVASLPVSTIVEQSLEHSDNDAAETLTWQVALAKGRPATFADASAQFAVELKARGLWAAGMQVVDGNGISANNKVTPTVLAQAVRQGLTDPGLREVVTGLPVAGVTGTLDDRFQGPQAQAGRGVIRAKTGTIRGVHALAGSVVSADGHPFVFAVILNGTAGSEAPRAFLDDITSALASCGCS